MRFIIVACGDRKQLEAAPLRDLYTGPLYQDRRAYAEASGHPWLILSAKHGLCDPAMIAEPYDQRVKDYSPVEKRAWALRVTSQLVQHAGRSQSNPRALRGVTVEMHVGRDYLTPLRREWELLGARVVTPVIDALPKASIGYQRRWYKQQREVAA